MRPLPLQDTCLMGLLCVGGKFGILKRCPILVELRSIFLNEMSDLYNLATWRGVKICTQILPYIS